MKYETQTKHGHNRRGKVSKTYMTWAGMMQRCYNLKDKSYPRYGGRNIKVCARWFEFENFLEDMGEKPEGLTLERVDNSKGYTPDNCKWATIIEQANNKRNNHLLTYKGKTQNLTQWSKETGIHRETLLSRIKKGYTPKEVIEHKKYANKR
ncbi:hypothetical protein LCGC14_2196500 [marine sediment metagenome]|uniref:Nuclease associated modular domain-containing protein n=1 Tax=marine sediment metagenome TaxID=412755 RepID=A0A0F9FVF4_9ZZZZ